MNNLEWIMNGGDFFGWLRAERGNAPESEGGPISGPETAELEPEPAKGDSGAENGSECKGNSCGDGLPDGDMIKRLYDFIDDQFPEGGETWRDGMLIVSKLKRSYVPFKVFHETLVEMIAAQDRMEQAREERDEWKAKAESALHENPYVGLVCGKQWERTERSEYYCGGCGWKVTDHDSFCPECGGALHGGSGNDAFPPGNGVSADGRIPNDANPVTDCGTADSSGCAECAEGLGKELDRRCDPLKERIAELEAELEAQRRRANDAERGVLANGWYVARDRYEDDLAELRAERDALESAANTLRASVAGLKGTVERQEGTIAAQRRELARFNAGKRGRRRLPKHVAWPRHDDGKLVKLAGNDALTVCFSHGGCLVRYADGSDEYLEMDELRRRWKDAR